jgi:hypothetical protein
VLGEDYLQDLIELAGVGVGINPIVTFEKRRLNMIGNLG